MKRYIFYIGCIVALSVRSYGQFNFTIEGEVEGGENLILALVIPSQSEDKRLITTVSNGHFKFEGTAQHDVLGKIMFEEDIVDYTGAYSFFPLIISGGATKIKYRIKRQEGSVLRYQLEDLRIVSGNIAIAFKQLQDRISAEVFKGLRFYSDSARMDSVNKYMLPAKRKRFESLFTTISDSIDNSYIKLKLLEIVAFSQLYEDNHYITVQDKNFILAQFKVLENEINGFDEYEYLKTKFYKFGMHGLSFTDYELEDTTGKKIKLSEIIAQHDYTVLYFWWTHCLPCRSFNKSEALYYSNLKKQGIEFVSINTDNSKTKWLKSSGADQIPWINLYSGNYSTIVAAYEVNSYPTKIIFDKNFNIVDFQFKTLNDLERLTMNRN